MVAMRHTYHPKARLEEKQEEVEEKRRTKLQGSSQYVENTVVNFPSNWSVYSTLGFTEQQSVDMCRVLTQHVPNSSLS